MTSTTTVLLALLCTGCAASDSRHTRAADSARATSGRIASDCLGPDSNVSIGVGHIGTLVLDLPVDSIRRRCASVRDTVVRGDELLDTAIVISRPNLDVIGSIATIEDDEGRHSVQIDGNAPAKYWTVVGTAGVLPRGVPLTATWHSLRAAYGSPANISYLNGDIDAIFCNAPGLVFGMSKPAGTDAGVGSMNQPSAGDSRILRVQMSTRLTAADSARADCRRSLSSADSATRFH